MPRSPRQSPIRCQFFEWHLRQRSNGVFFADGRNNKQYALGRPSLNTRDLAEAMEKLKQLDEEMAIQYGLTTRQEATTNVHELDISGGWALYFKRCEKPEILGGVTRVTLKRYRAVRDKHLDFCKSKSIRFWMQVNKKTTEDYAAWLTKRGLSDRTLGLELNTVCSATRWLVQEGHLPESARFQIKVGKPDGSTTYCYSKSQVTRMVEYCHAHPRLHWFANVIIGLASTGMRVNELAGLRRSDIDLQAGTIRLTDERSRSSSKRSGNERRIKGKRGRVIPLHPVLRSVIEALPLHRDGLVFHTQAGTRLVDRRILENLQGKVIKPLVREFPTPAGEIGFKDGTVHGLRHYFCSEAYRSGATDAELLAWLGHTDSNITKIYRHLRPEDGQRRMQKIQFFGSGPEEIGREGVA